MTKAPLHDRTKTGSRRRNPTEPPRFRSPIRVSIDREALAAIDKQALAAQVGIGLVAGWLASWIVGGDGLLRYALSGLAGPFVGGVLLERLGIDLGLRSELARRIVTATIGAMVVILAARVVA